MAFLAAWLILGEWALQTNSAGYIAHHPVAVWRVLAYLVFGLLLALETKLGMQRIVVLSSEISYSLYLMHLPVGYGFLSLTTPFIPYPIALVVALTGTWFASWGSYRIIERPSQQLARVLSAKIGETVPSLRRPMLRPSQDRRPMSSSTERALVPPEVDVAAEGNVPAAHRGVKAEDPPGGGQR